MEEKSFDLWSISFRLVTFFTFTDLNHHCPHITVIIPMLTQPRDWKYNKGFDGQRGFVCFLGVFVYVHIYFLIWFCYPRLGLFQVPIWGRQSIKGSQMLLVYVDVHECLLQVKKTPTWWMSFIPASCPPVWHWTTRIRTTFTSNNNDFL